MPFCAWESQRRINGANSRKQKRPEKQKNQIAEAIWLVVEMRGIEPLTS